jgi:flagellar biosynthesis chaperone FliJ
VKTAENKSVNYNGLIGVLIEAIKEQQKQIEELKKLINN